MICNRGAGLWPPNGSSRIRAKQELLRVEEGTSAVLLQSGLDENWWAGSMECLSFLRNVQDLVWWEDALWKTFWAAIQRTNHSVWFIGWVLPYFCERPGNNPSIWNESLTWIVLRIRSLCGGNLEGWLLGCRHWRVGKRWTHQKSTLKDSMQKEVIFPKENGKFKFPVEDGRITLSGRDQELRTSTLIRERPIRGESHVVFLGESEGSLSPPHDSFPDAG